MAVARKAKDNVSSISQNGCIVLTAERARASGLDAGNMHMRKHGRSKWNDDDFNRAVSVTNRLMLSVPVALGGLHGFPFTHQMIDDLGITVADVIRTGNRLIGHNGGPEFDETAVRKLCRKASAPNAKLRALYARGKAVRDPSPTIRGALD